MSNLGLNLKKLRKARGLNQNELAQIIGVGKTTISNYETGYTEPTNATLRQLAAFFNVSTDTLINGPIIVEPKPEKTDQSSLRERGIDSYNSKSIPVYLSWSDADPYAAPIHQVFLPPSVVGEGDFFGLQISGDRMDRASLPDGSIAIIRRQTLVDDGDVVAVSFGNNPVFICRFYRMGEYISLLYESNNPVHRPLMINAKDQGLKVHGKVIKSIQSIF